MTKEEIIEHLNFEVHPTEGGYFKRTYESKIMLEKLVKNRRLLTSIYYMLTDDRPVGYMHKNKSDIIHYYHLGGSIKYTIITAQGELQEKVLGPHLEKGEVLQLVVKGGDWKAAELVDGYYGLLSEAVAPGFEYEDNEIAQLESMRQLYPALETQYARTIKKNSGQ